MVLGDVISSRKVNNRDAYYDSLQEVVSFLNTSFANSFETAFELYAGDSFGVVVKSEEVGRLITVLTDLLHPIKVRLVVVKGTILKGLESKDFTQLDGPALWKANEMVQQLKKNKRFVAFALNRPDWINESLNGMANLVLATKYNWHNNKLKAIRGVVSGKTQAAIGAELSLKQQTVAKHLKEPYEIFIEAEEAFHLLTKNYCHGGD